MNCEFIPLAEFGLERAAEVLRRGFADYFVPIPCTTGMLLEMARTDSVDLAASRVVVRAGAAVGAALMARRGLTCRLAGMALVPEGRRQGTGRALVDRLLADAKARGERTMVLEVIEQNKPAVKLYEACGFRHVGRLSGFSCRPDDSGAVVADLGEVDLREAAAAVTAHGPADLPWQLSGETVAHLAPPAVAYRQGNAWAAISNPAAPQVTIRALVADRSGNGPERLGALLRTVMARHPGRQWRASALWPEEYGAVFTAAGFERTSISQFLMTRELG